MTDLSTQTPVEIDTQIAELLARRAPLVRTRDYYRDQAARASEDAVKYAASAMHFAKQASKANDAAENCDTQIYAINSEIATLEAEYRRRGTWTRAFLVSNSQGHVHSSTACSTCFETTEFFWVTEFSGHEENEIVEAAGERACTVCYPSAPVEVLSRPTRIFSDDEKKAHLAREGRAAKAAERDAAKVTLVLWDNRYTRTGRVLAREEITYKTVRALQNDAGSLVREIAGAYASINGFRLDVKSWNHDLGRYVDGEHIAEANQNLFTMLEALKARGIDTHALVEKNRKRAEKER